jgi:outer membrane protein assembly factor BamB
LDPDWQVHPPRVVWRQPVGAAWSGWAVVGGRALTQEQRGEEECSTCYETLTGRLLWCHREPAHYHTTLGGEGPRCTPTVVSNRVFTLGATGRLNCLDLATGRRVWFRDIAADARSKMPGWGFAGSALVFDGLVVVSAGGARDRSLLAYRADTGDLAWTGGSDSAGYGSPQLVTLAGRRQILAFNSHRISAHDPASGAVLWEYPWGIGQPHVTAPVVVGADRILFSSGYGVGAELLEIRPDDAGHLNAVRVWKSTKMKSKFATLVQRDGFLFGLDDGVLACLDLRDGSQAWRGNRYGHGQGLLVGDLLLQMAEDGELVLLRPTPAAPNELHRFRVFNGKTWNPIALAGDILLVRTDQEAACLRVALRMGLDKAGRI